MHKDYLFCLFKEAEDLQEKMRDIFKRNNLKYNELKYLSEKDFEKWIVLYKKGAVLTKKNKPACCRSNKEIGT